ncbi:MAG: hypothetical protein E2O39_16920 [Planctomycetota bacterium]|nr:MAG: hypothetical protein E2O39_16920 [Planctomycetota bacterium]
MIWPSLVAFLVTAAARPAELPPPAPLLGNGATTEAPQRRGRKSKATPKVQYHDGEWEAAKQQKDVREILRVFKLELDARALWAELLAAEQAGKSGKARSIAKKLLVEKYAETAEAEQARAKYPELQ